MLTINRIKPTHFIEVVGNKYDATTYCRDCCFIKFIEDFTSHTKQTTCLKTVAVFKIKLKDNQDIANEIINKALAA